MKKTIALFSLFSVVLFIFTYLMIYVFKDNNLDSNIVVFLYNNDTDEYIKVSGVPEGEYIVDKDKTSCVSGGDVKGYDLAKYKITYTLGSADSCEVYLKSSDETLGYYIRNEVYNSETNKNAIASGITGLYYHDGSIKTEDGKAILDANDNSYRYAGEDPNNYVCFEGSVCTDINNLYRIISVDSENRVKLITATSIGNLRYNDVYTHDGTSYQIITEKAYTATGSEYDKNMNLTQETVYTNIWAIKRADGSYYTASLNKYLNENYIQSLGSNVRLLENTTWCVGGASNSGDLNKKNVHDFMQSELNYQKGTYSSKIGLMYAYEYGYAALPSNWSHKLYSNATDGYNSSFDNNWLLKDSYPWTISRINDSILRIFVAHSLDGNITVGNVFNSRSTYPTFVLKPTAKVFFKSDDNVGSMTNPMIIK